MAAGKPVAGSDDARRQQRAARLAALSAVIETFRPAAPGGKAALIRGRDLSMAAICDVPAARQASGQAPSQAASACMPLVPAWGLGAPEVDRMLGQEGLAVGGVHEIKPVLTAGGLHAADRAAALLFALLLARRRLDGLARLPAAAGPSSILWCARQSDLKEFGRLHMPGLAALGIASEGFVFVETSSREDTLWAIEQGMMSGALAMVVGLVDDVGLTPARRLSLVAERTATPCLLLTPPRSMPVASVATRWRLGRARAGPHPFDPRAPGAARLAITLERCLSRPLAAAAPAFTLEWSDETHRFHMAAGVADRADAPVASRGIASRRVA